MKALKKLALVTAIAAAPFTANALEALDDEFLGEVSGQEGITIDKTYFNTIEEFQYVDADGDGSGTAGKIKITDIEIGQFTGANFGIVDPSGAAGLTAVSEVGQMIDATANGVLITAANIGQEAVHGAGEAAAAAAKGIALDASGNVAGLAAASGNNQFTAYANGKDISIGGIEFGNSAGALNSIGSVKILNASNFATSGRIMTLVNKYGVAGGDFATSPQAQALYFNNANDWVRNETLISSKASGTGVIIEAEGGISAQAVFYSDTDDGGNVGIVGLNQFRIVATDSRSAAQDLATGTHIRGAYTKTELDVVGGKLQLKQTKDSSTVLNAIIIAADADLATAINTNGGAYSIGGIAILGNHWEGTTSIYAH